MQGIPVVGAILVNPGLDRCLLVRGWGNQGSWGFPRGKINENEPDAACAVREVRLFMRVQHEDLASGSGSCAVRGGILKLRCEGKSTKAGRRCAVRRCSLVQDLASGCSPWAV